MIAIYVNKFCRWFIYIIPQIITNVPKKSKSIKVITEVHILLVLQSCMVSPKLGSILDKYQSPTIPKNHSKLRNISPR